MLFENKIDGTQLKKGKKRQYFFLITGEGRNKMIFTKTTRALRLLLDETGAQYMLSVYHADIRHDKLKFVSLGRFLPHKFINVP